MPFFENDPLAGGQVGAGVALENSALFDRAGSLSYTVPVGADRRTNTVSFWVRRVHFHLLQGLVCAGSIGAVASYGGIHFNAANDLIMLDGNIALNVGNNGVKYRDIEWIHVVRTLDTTQGFARLYLNGQLATEGTVTLNAEGNFLGNTPHFIGADSSGNNIGALISDLYIISGQALLPTSFAEHSATTGNWEPIRYASQFGSFDMHLEFLEGAPGSDSSGNGHNWTASSVAHSLDTPTNVGPVFNSLRTSVGSSPWTVANGAGTASVVSDGGKRINFQAGRSRFSSNPLNLRPRNTKIYLEVRNEISYVAGEWFDVGMSPNDSLIARVASDPQRSFAVLSSSVFAGGDFNVANTVMGLAIDNINGMAWVRRNGVWNGSGDPVAGTNPDFTWSPTGDEEIVFSGFGLGVTLQLLTTDDEFQSARPEGFGLPSFSSLPEVNYLLSNTFFQGSYLGTGVSNGDTQTINFQDDIGDPVDLGSRHYLLRIKSRVGATTASEIYDTARGPNLALQLGVSSVSDPAEQNLGGVTSLTGTGFTVSRTSSTLGTNQNGVTYYYEVIAAGDTQETDNVGTVTSTVYADDYSAIVLVPSCSPGATIGHRGSLAGREVATIIGKRRDSVSAWPYNHAGIHPSAGNINSLFYNQTSANASVTSEITQRTPTTFTLGSWTAYTGSWVFYIRYKSEVFSARTYSGNNNTFWGPYLNANGSAQSIEVKRWNGTGNWPLLNRSSDLFNVMSHILYANSTAADLVAVSTDGLGGGAKKYISATDENGAGSAYISNIWLKPYGSNVMPRGN